MEFKIEHTWDSLPVSHEPVSVRLKSGSAGLLMEVSAPFFNDPPAPLGEPGKPFSGLWDYEVVEAFFLSERTKQYLEVELCPRNVFTNNHQTKSLEGKRSEGSELEPSGVGRSGFSERLENAKNSQTLEHSDQLTMPSIRRKPTHPNGTEANNLHSPVWGYHRDAGKRS
ncbi:UPF0462 protein C4orf33 homolog isoform X14 [Gopherus flavomarginatus]|uniref:UPF0462 protein C4orf33 homolog isoform X14 n=1 Tax=Gopherus flavomarginatus TaxID=286002 RepID=UPI0021CBD85D|nr:UPF0462 protein C4orf33 homolog isoform X14 [Gopherus flavomarginatus]